MLRIVIAYMLGATILIASTCSKTYEQIAKQEKAKKEYATPTQLVVKKGMTAKSSLSRTIYAELFMGKETTVDYFQKRNSLSWEFKICTLNRDYFVFKINLPYKVKRKPFQDPKIICTPANIGVIK